MANHQETCVNPTRKKNNELISFQLLVLFILFPLRIYMVKTMLVGAIVSSLDPRVQPLTDDYCPAIVLHLMACLVIVSGVAMGKCVHNQSHYLHLLP